MSDFGYDTHAFDEEDARGQPHPFEIARNLIDTGKPRSALEVLSLHHDAFADDPTYLLICSEAWWSIGEPIRAQQALLGAARLDPEDPTPLQMLGELLRERGEHEKAERAFSKARALEITATIDESSDDARAAPDEDLIAHAQRKERRLHAGLTPTQVLGALAALAALGGLIASIALLTERKDLRTAAAPEIETAPASETAPAFETAPETEIVPETAPAPETASEIETASETAPETEIVPETAPEIEIETASENAPAPAPATKASRPPSRRPARRPKEQAHSGAVAAQPDATVVEKELASMDAESLSRRADALHAQGHTGIAASYYRRALDIDPDFAPALVGIGRSILRAEKYVDAMRNATRALELARGVDARPGLESEAIYQMARVHLHRGQLDAARMLLRQSISLPGTPADAWFYLGEALWSDNSPAARDAYEKYLERVPTGHLADRARRAIR